ncbi:protein-glutamate methylesterase/protein-glutamine glutaminase [Chondrinema litorale]|uniref:protein-glutamate methylesterase/protein-glutamine glutaminase n=1 Tax=Chondrinema litorale TaxID=2994555 RepID=UPI0025437230|nr:chemotaxis response regulator protein-glutamate methylesterase [Chondrinema litorale]UZR99679.1 chemotaxis response regulator protein-glutamate methylesterase [Chondrinema litorale]
MKKIKVLIVDDSALVRQTLVSVFSEDRSIEVVGTAADPYMAAQKLTKTVPDVITLDIEMPKMDGLTFLKKIMTQHPIPVVIISSLTAKGTEMAMKALEYGAVEILTKPQLHLKSFFEEYKLRLFDIIKAASVSRIKRRSAITVAKVPAKVNVSEVIARRQNNSLIKTTEKVVAIGASTGGTEAIKDLLQALPGDSPGVVIVQHMPEQFTKSFAQRLDGICEVTVKEASHGDNIIRGRVLIAPGNKHMVVKRNGARYYVELLDSPLVNRHRPSVDVLFRSVANFAGKNSIGVILTGMGADGAQGLLDMREAGALTIAQDERSSVVFGMPKKAIELNAVEKVLSLDFITPFILRNL